MTPLYQQLSAYYEYLLGHPSTEIAEALEISPRTVRSWAEKENWEKDREEFKAMVRGLIAADLLKSFAVEPDAAKKALNGRLADFLVFQRAKHRATRKPRTRQESGGASIKPRS